MTPSPHSINQIRDMRGSSRLTVDEIARDLAINRDTVYDMLKRKQIPGIRAGRIWIITRHAYGRWKETCGMDLMRAS